MAVETPDKNVSEILADEVRVNGDFGRAQDEIIRRLKSRMNAVIAAKNIARGWTTDAQKIPENADVVIGGTDTTKYLQNTVYVLLSVDTSSFGAQAFLNAVTVQIYSIDAAVQVPKDIRVHWARAEAIRAVLFQFVSGCVNDKGQVCWNQLEPTGCEILGDDWPNRSGTVCTFSMTLPPGND